MEGGEREGQHNYILSSAKSAPLASCLASGRRRQGQDVLKDCCGFLNIQLLTVQDICTNILKQGCARLPKCDKLHIDFDNEVLLWGVLLYHYIILL